MSLATFRPLLPPESSQTAPAASAAAKKSCGECMRWRFLQDTCGGGGEGAVAGLRVVCLVGANVCGQITGHSNTCPKCYVSRVRCEAPA